MGVTGRARTNSGAAGATGACCPPRGPARVRDTRHQERRPACSNGTAGCGWDQVEMEGLARSFFRGRDRGLIALEPGVPAPLATGMYALERSLGALARWRANGSCHRVHDP